MRGFARLLLASTVTLALLAAGASTGLAKEGGNLIVFDSMTPVTGASTVATAVALSVAEATFR